MTRIVTAPPPQFFPQQQAPRPRAQFNIGGGSGNDDAIALALLQFLSNQQQAQSTQELRQQQFGLEERVAEEQITQSEVDRRNARRERIRSTADRQIGRMGDKFQQQQASFTKESRKQFRQGADTLDFFVRRVQAARRDVIRGETGSVDTAIRLAQQIRDQVEGKVEGIENPFVRAGLATQFGELLGNLQSAAEVKGNTRLFQAVDEIAFSSQQFIQFGGSSDALLADALSQRETAFRKFQGNLLDQLQGEFAQFDDPNLEVSDTRLRQRIDEAVRESSFTPPSVDQLAFELEPLRPFRPVEDVPGQPGVLQQIGELPDQFRKGASEFLTGTPPIQAGASSPQSTSLGSELLLPLLAAGATGLLGQGGLTPGAPGESPVRFKPDQEPTPTNVPLRPVSPTNLSSMNFGIDIPGPLSAGGVPDLLGAAGINPLQPPSIPGFRGFNPFGQGGF